MSSCRLQAERSTSVYFLVQFNTSGVVGISGIKVHHAQNQKQTIISNPYILIRKEYALANCFNLYGGSYVPLDGLSLIIMQNCYHAGLLNDLRCNCTTQRRQKAIRLVKTKLVDAIGHVRQAVMSRGTRLHGETKKAYIDCSFPSIVFTRAIQSKHFRSIV